MKQQSVPAVLLTIAAAVSFGFAETCVKDSVKTCKSSAGCEKKYAGYGGFLGGAGYVDMKPIRAVLVSETALNGAKSPIYGKGLEKSMGDRELMAFTGGFGMGGKRDGVRLGGGGIHGVQRSRTVHGDSSYTVETQLSYGGVMAGNVLTKGKNSIGFTGLIGAGAMEMNIYSSSVSGLDNSVAKEWEFDEDLAILSGKSYFFATDLTANYTYSFTRWLHAGVDLGGAVNYSIRGFNGNDGYTTFTPMIRGRVAFGIL